MKKITKRQLQVKVEMTKQVVDPLAMSMVIATAKDELPSLHTHMKQMDKLKRYSDQLKSRMQLEVDKCYQDQINFSQE